jgi:MoxR-like ATPase
MAEREVNVPRVGRIHASESFRLVASMNPFDAIGTTRISQAVYDRMCRLAINYQTAEEDRSIVALRTDRENDRLVADAVAITRSTRAHPDVRYGSSVRGAIDLVAVAGPLAEIRGASNGTPEKAEESYRAIALDAALLALSGRITVDETAEVGPEQIIRELWENHFVLLPARAKGGEHSIEVREPT